MDTYLGVELRGQILTLRSVPELLHLFIFPQKWKKVLVFPMSSSPFASFWGFVCFYDTPPSSINAIDISLVTKGDHLFKCLVAAVFLGEMST